MSDERTSSTLSRRRFFGKSIVALGVAPVAFKILGQGGPAHAQAPTMKPVDPASPLAQGLQYVPDTTKVDKAKFPQHNDTQTCGTCMLLSEKGLKAEGAEGEWGRCQVIADGLVNVNGWCVSWVLKPA